MPVPFPEVLAPDYTPPVLFGRAVELERLREWLLGPPSPGSTPRIASVVGPSGSGTSVLTRVAARRWVEALRREDPMVRPVLATVRVRWCRGSQSIAAALVQHLDDGFRATGFPINEILAGFLRRLRRDGRPAVVVLDDIGRSAPDLTPILRAFAHPGRFLPEGVDDPPKVWLLLAGAPEAVGAWAQTARAESRRRDTSLPAARAHAASPAARRDSTCAGRSDRCRPAGSREPRPSPRSRAQRGRAPRAAPPCTASSHSDT